MFCQWIQVNILYGSFDGVISVIAGTAFGLPGESPVGGLVADASVPGAIDKGFEQINRVAVLYLPVRTDPFCNLGQDMTGQMGNPYPGKDQKTGVIGEVAKIFPAHLAVPTDKVVARSAFPGGRAE